MKRARSRKGAPGIIEVAKRAKVSPATVSRFFNDPDIVRPVTRKKIESAANDLGYIRDRMASAMHHGFSGTIGLIVPTIANAIFSELIQAFSERLLQHDRTMLVAAHGYDLKLEVGIVRALLERRIDGVALVGFAHDPVPLEMLAVRNVPVLEIWNYRPQGSLSCVGADNVEAGYEVTRYILERGHKKILLAFPPTDANDRAADRLEGAIKAFSADVNFNTEHHLLETRYDIGEAKQRIRSALESQRFTAIVCGNDVIAQGAVYACQNMGLKIPDDISIIGIGDFHGSAEMEPGLTTWRLPARRIGETAADALCNEGFAHQKHVKITSSIVERGSVARI